MTIEQIVELLAKKAGKKKTLTQSDVEAYFEFGTPEYYDIERQLALQEIDVLLNDDEEEKEESTSVIDDLELEDDDLEESEPDEFSLSSLEVEDIKEEELLNIEQIVTTIKVDDPVRMYLKEIGQIPLLNIDDERKYAIWVSDGRVAQEQMDLYKSGQLELSDQDANDLDNIIRKAHLAKEKL